MSSQNLGRVVGKSAYELAKDDGFSGTLQEWLTSLHGEDGANGTNGINGVDGITPDFQIGDVTTLPAGSAATATITGTPEIPILNMGIPRGDKGEDGSGSEGGIAEAPEDGKQYARQDAAWVEVEASGAYDDSQIKADITSLQNNKADKTEIPDVSGFATSVELQSMNVSLTASIAAKQPAGDYATNTSLTQGLETKQPAGDYATNAALTQGLATKQPAGDYATNTALTQGLATKQPVGEYALESDMPTVPTALPNPNAITINGTSYDGSEAVTLNIESGGGEGAALATDEEWNTGTTTAKAPNVAQVKEQLLMPSLQNIIYDIQMPILTSNGTPYVDVYSVEAPAVFPEYPAYKVTNSFVDSSANYNSWYSSGGGITNFTLYFKNKILADSISIKNSKYDNEAVLKMDIAVTYDKENWSIALKDVVNPSGTTPFGDGVIDLTSIEKPYYGLRFIIPIQPAYYIGRLRLNNSRVVETIEGELIGLKEQIEYNFRHLPLTIRVSNPLGAIIGWELPTLPSGFLWCDGSAVPNEYPELQALMVNTPTKEGFIIQAMPL